MWFLIKTIITFGFLVTVKWLCTLHSSIKNVNMLLFISVRKRE